MCFGVFVAKEPLTDGNTLLHHCREAHSETKVVSGIIIKDMARGWESKSVEDQIGAAEAKREARRRATRSSDENEQIRRKEKLLLERARVVREMERAYMRRHLVVLERGLAYIDAELGKLEENGPK